MFVKGRISDEAEQERRRKISLASKKHWKNKAYASKQSKSRKASWENDTDRRKATGKRKHKDWENNKEQIVANMSKAATKRYRHSNQYEAIVAHCRSIAKTRDPVKWMKNLKKGLKGKRSWGQYKSLYKGVSGVFWMRSSWEVKFAEWLDQSNIRWLYEPINFYIGVGSWNNRSYKPDFYLPDLDVFIEIKGRLLDREKKRLAKFRKLYPDLHWFMLREDDLKVIGVLDVRRCEEVNVVQITNKGRLNTWLQTLAK